MDTNPSSVYATVTPHDTNSLPRKARALYIGTAGDLTVINMQGNSVTFVGISGLLPIVTQRVMATGTTADDIVYLA